MKAELPQYLAWLLPSALLTHQVEEYAGGFPQWFSTLLAANLSNSDFILINAVGLFLAVALSVAYYVTKSGVPLVALGTLAFVNGSTHLLASLVTFTYSPGTLSGTVLFLPLGFLVFRNVYPSLSSGERFAGVVIGLVMLLAASTIAMNI